jgi:hypothetical protein
MPWVRIDENAMDHPKFLAISANAWRLWCEGLCYCQKHLTDGLISRLALKCFRYYSPASFKMLTEPLVAGKGPLWHEQADGDVTVHDYLDWNDSRERVHQLRDGAKARRQKFGQKDETRSERVPNSVPNGVPNASTNAFQDASRPRGVCVGDSSLAKKQELSSHARGMQPTDFKATNGRPGDFIDRYKELHVKHRHGAHYVSHPQKDFPDAALLCDTYDDERLDKLATVFLTTDHDFAEQGTRTIAKFRSMASWCDERLRAKGL